MNKLIEDMGGGLSRETDFNAPAQETQNARYEQIGPFCKDNPTQSQAATAMLLCNVATQDSFVAGRAGTIVGLIVRSNADLSAGTATAKALKGGSAISGGTAVLSDTVQQKITNLTTPVSFSAGDLLAMTIETDGSYAPATADMVGWILVRWTGDSI